MAQPPKGELVRGHDKPRRMGVAIAIYFLGGIVGIVNLRERNGQMKSTAGICFKVFSRQSRADNVRRQKNHRDKGT